MSHPEMRSHVVRTSGGAGTASYAGNTQQELRDERPGVSTAMAVATVSGGGDDLPPPRPRVRHIPPGTHTVLSARHRLKCLEWLQGKCHEVKQNCTGIEECS